MFQGSQRTVKQAIKWARQLTDERKQALLKGSATFRRGVKERRGKRGIQARKAPHQSCGEGEMPMMKR